MNGGKQRDSELIAVTDMASWNPSQIHKRVMPGVQVARQTGVVGPKKQHKNNACSTCLQTHFLVQLVQVVICKVWEQQQHE